MAISWRLDPHDAARVGTDAYGHNGEGALALGLALTVVETLVLAGALRPWSYTRASWLRPLLVLLLAVPWTLVSAVLTMHAGGVIVIHLLWLLIIDAAVVVALVATILLEVASRRAAVSGGKS